MTDIINERLAEIDEAISGARDATGAYANAQANIAKEKIRALKAELIKGAVRIGDAADGNPDGKLGRGFVRGCAVGAAVMLLAAIVVSLIFGG